MRYKSGISLSMFVLMGFSLYATVLADSAPRRSDDNYHKIEQQDKVRENNLPDASLQKNDTDEGLSIKLAKYLTLYVVVGGGLFVAAAGLTGFMLWKASQPKDD